MKKNTKALSLIGLLILAITAVTPNAARADDDATTETTAKGLIIDGATGVLVPWAAGYYIAAGIRWNADSNQGVLGTSEYKPLSQTMLIPVAGPWINLAKQEQGPGQSAPGLRPMLAIDGAIQTVSAAALVSGLIMEIVHSADGTSASAPKYAKVEDKADAKKPSALSITGVSPSAGNGSPGLTVVGAF